MDDIKTGRIYTGREALKIGLIDAIGDEQTAIKWFTDVRKVASGLKVKDWKPQSSVSGFFNLLSQAWPESWALPLSSTPASWKGWNL